MNKKGRGSRLVRAELAFYAQVRAVIVEAQRYVHKTANVAMVKAYWLVGKMIVEKQGGVAKAAYGDGLIDALAERLTAEFGAGFTRVNLFAMRKFYLSFPKVQTLCEQLSWSHYRLLITVENEEARQYYAEECRKSLWSVRELQRQINSFYFERLLENRTKRGRKYAAAQRGANLCREKAMVVRSSDATSASLPYFRKIVRVRLFREGRACPVRSREDFARTPRSIRKGH